jgi:predicted MFS family arabinose efflux permease
LNQLIDNSTRPTGNPAIVTADQGQSEAVKTSVMGPDARRGDSSYGPHDNESSIVKLGIVSPEANAPWTFYSRRRRWIFLSVLFLIATSSNFDYYVLGIVLDPIKNEFHVSDGALGLLTGFCFALFYALGAFPFARWSDRGNRRSVLVVSLAGWSVMTMCSGLSRTFWQLAASRLGVGAMQPGATPPAQSLIIDYFPPERRGAAIAIMQSGGSVGYFIGVALGGYIAATLGWRNAFLLAGALGVILAVFTRLLLAEPRVRLGFPSANPNAESSRSALAQLSAKPSFVYTVIGISIFYFFNLGVTTFLPSLMMRSLHVSLEQVSMTWGVAVALANFIGTLLGGWVADRLGRRDIRWYAWMSAVACILGAPLYWIALSSNHLSTLVAVEFVAELVLWTGTFATWPAMHAVCGSPRRGTAIAVATFAYVLVGAGLGPMIAGILSDALSTTAGQEGLRYSLDIMTGFLLPAAIIFYWSGRTMLSDSES